MIILKDFVSYVFASSKKPFLLLCLSMLVFYPPISCTPVSHDKAKKSSIVSNKSNPPTQTIRKSFDKKIFFGEINIFEKDGIKYLEIDLKKIYSGKDAIAYFRDLHEEFDRGEMKSDEWISRHHLPNGIFIEDLNEKEIFLISEMVSINIHYNLKKKQFGNHQNVSLSEFYEAFKNEVIHVTKANYKVVTQNGKVIKITSQYTP